MQFKNGVIPDTVQVNGRDHSTHPDAVRHVEEHLASFNELTRTGSALSAEQWRSVEEGVEYLKQIKRYERLADAATFAGATGDGAGTSLGAPSFRRQSSDAAGIDRSAWDVDLDRLGPSQLRDSAMRAIERTHGRKLDRMDDAAFEKASTLVESNDMTEATRAARWAVVASDPAYESAFAKLVRDPQRGHLEWNDTERSAYARTNEVARAMSLTDANGGYMVPFTLDPAIMLTNDGSNNPLRQLARIVQTTTDSWNGVTSAGASSEWKDEAAEAADGSPTLAQPSIPVFTGDSFVPYSFEYGMDAVNMMTELSSVLLDSADNLMAAAYTTGNGTSAPQGIVTGLAGTGSEINGLGTEVIAATDPYRLQDALPARFSANATWQGHISVLNTYRQFETGNGAHEFPELRDNPPYLLGRRWYENSNMASTSTLNPAATGNWYGLVYGDVRRGFVIVDRIGTTIELIPNLMGDNNRPTGQRGAFLWFRTGSEVVVPQALRLLDVPTTA